MLAVRTQIAQAVLALIYTYGSGTVLGTERMLVNGEGAHGSTSIVDASSNRWQMTQTGTSGTDFVTVATTGNAWTNTTQPAPARGNSAMYFNMASCVSTPKNSALYPSASSDWTVDLFVMIPTGGLTQNGILWHSAGGNSGTWTDFNVDMIQLTNGRYQFEWSNGTATQTSGVIGTVLNTNIWRHYGLVYTASGKSLAIYVDGVLDATVDMTTYAPPATTPRFTLGRYDPILGSPNGYFKGYMDRFRFTPSRRWTGNFTVDDDVINDAVPALVGLGLHCNGTNGTAIATNLTSLVDNSPYAVSPASALNATLNTANKRFGSAALQLAGGYVKYPASSVGHNLNGGDFTIETWFYVTSVGTLMRLMTHQNGSASQTQYNYHIRYNTDGTIIGQVMGGSTVYSAISPSAVPLNAWNHIAFVRLNGNITVYLNGVPGTTVTGPANGTINNLTNATLMIGADLDGSNNSTCLLDDVRLTKSARYSAAFTPQWTAFGDAGLGTVLGTENFIFAGDGAEGGTTITDSSSNALAVTNTGMTTTTTRSARGAGSLATGASGGYIFTGNTAKAYMGGASSWTFDCFVYMTSYPPAYWQVVFCSNQGGSGWSSAHMFDLTINSAGKTGIEVANGASTPLTNVGIGTVIPLNTWTHIAVVWDSVGKTIKIYLNGVLDTTTNITTFSSYSATPRTTIGRTDPTVANPVYNLSNAYIDRARLTPSVRWTANFTPD